MADTPVREVRTIIEDSGDPGYVNRILIGTAATGNVRMEWAQARWGQLIPVNWSSVQVVQWMSGYIPLRYQVADAQNLIVQAAIERDFEWLLLIEHDVVLPPDAFIKFNQYMIDAKTPVVSGLYYTRSIPSEPLIFRGRGNGVFDKWQKGDAVWCDGVPTGCLLIHMAIMREMWKESPEYEINYGKRNITRRVFYTPNEMWYDPETNNMHSITGTSDLEWCSRVMRKKFFEKSGWHKFQEMQYPFLVDTSIACRHVNPDGGMFPP